MAANENQNPIEQLVTAVQGVNNKDQKNPTNDLVSQVENVVKEKGNEIREPQKVTNESEIKNQNRQSSENSSSITKEDDKNKSIVSLIFEFFDDLTFGLLKKLYNAVFGKEKEGKKEGEAILSPKVSEGIEGGKGQEKGKSDNLSNDLDAIKQSAQEFMQSAGSNLSSIFGGKKPAEQEISIKTEGKGSNVQNNQENVSAAKQEEEKEKKNPEQALKEAIEKAKDDPEKLKEIEVIVNDFKGKYPENEDIKKLTDSCTQQIEGIRKEQEKEVEKDNNKDELDNDTKDQLKGVVSELKNSGATIDEKSNNNSQIGAAAGLANEISQEQEGGGR